MPDDKTQFRLSDRRISQTRIMRSAISRRNMASAKHRSGTDLSCRQRPRETRSSLRPLSLQYALGQRWRFLTMIKPSPHETLVRARIAVDQVRLSRLATQNAIERNRQSLAEMKAVLVALRDAESSALPMKVQRRINAMKLRQAS
jgi:hypothetical protein